MEYTVDVSPEWETRFGALDQEEAALAAKLALYQRRISGVQTRIAEVGGMREAMAVAAVRAARADLPKEITVTLAPDRKTVIVNAPVVIID